MPPTVIREAIAIRLLAGLADGGDDAPPVRVLAGDRRLDEGRVGDRQGDSPRRLLRGGAADGDGDELTGPLAVADDLMRQGRP